MQTFELSTVIQNAENGCDHDFPDSGSSLPLALDTRAWLAEGDGFGACGDRRDADEDEVEQEGRAARKDRPYKWFLDERCGGRQRRQ